MKPTIRLWIQNSAGCRTKLYNGSLGMQADRGSKFPVEAINAGMTGSSATLIYCGVEKGPDSLMLHLCGILLHPLISKRNGSGLMILNCLQKKSMAVINTSGVAKKVYKFQ